MSKPNWKVEFVGIERHRRETTFHPTRERALTAAYARLDLAQRDALSLGEQSSADSYGRERGIMASSWTKAARSTGRIYSGVFITITRHKVTK